MLAQKEECVLSAGQTAHSEVPASPHVYAARALPHHPGTDEAGVPQGLSDLSRVSYAEGEGRARLRKLLENQGWAKLRLSVLFTHPLASSSAQQQEPVLGLGTGKNKGPSQGGLGPCVTPLPPAMPRARWGGAGASLALLTLLLPCLHPPTLQRGSRPHQ